MPVHNWKPIDAGIFHALHHGWITEIAKVLNRGFLRSDYYALPEHIAGWLGPDVLTLQRPGQEDAPALDNPGGVALVTAPPRVQMRFRSEPDQYEAKAKAVIIRHTSKHQVIAMVEIVSPGNKNSRHGLRAFVDKAVRVLRGGIHLLIVDLLPPGPRDPQGIHKAIWDELIDNDFVLPPHQPLTLVAYLAGQYPEAFVEPTALQGTLADMPLFLSEETYVLVPLEKTYQSAFENLPAYWREVLSS